MRPLLLPLAILATVGLLWMRVTPAYACTCPVPATGQPPLQTYTQDSAIIVAGTVTALTISPPFDPNASPVQYRVYATFQTEEYLKGTGEGTLQLLAYALQVSQTGEIYTNLVGCQNFNPDTVDKRYVLFFGPGQPPTSDPGYCQGSGLLVGAQGEQYLQQIRDLLAATPTPAPSNTPTPRDASPLGFPAFLTPPVAGLPPTGSSGDRNDATPLIILSATLGSLTVVAASAFLIRRRG